MIACLLSGLLWVGLVFMIAGFVLRTVIKRQKWGHKAGVYIFGTGVLMSLPNVFVLNPLGAVVLLIAAAITIYLDVAK